MSKETPEVHEALPLDLAALPDNPIYLLMVPQRRIEQVLAVYRLQLQQVRRNYLRGRCPLPTHHSARSQQSFGVDTAKNVWACHSVSCCQARGGRVGGTVLDLVAYLEGCSITAARNHRGCGPHRRPAGPRHHKSETKCAGAEIPPQCCLGPSGTP